jgi:hypothetical protein
MFVITALVPVFLFGLVAIESNARAQTARDLLCRYENVYVPCLRLSRPKTFDNVRFWYRPLKAIPIWPNNSIFGGYEERPDEDQFNPDEFYNRAVSSTAVPDEQDIRSIEISSYDFGPGFAERLITTGRHRALMKVSDVFRGSEVFDLWVSALEQGVICGEVKTSDDDNAELVAECGFARRVNTKAPPAKRDAGHITIEYCGFERFAQTHVSSTPSCFTVAKKEGSGTKVLAARHTYRPLEGKGGGEGGLDCIFPDKTIEELKEKFEKFLAQYLGEGHKYGVRLGTSNVYHFRAEGINIKDNREDVWKRIYLQGAYGPRPSPTDDSLPGGAAWFSFVVTISYQDSDNIINYREPNQAMGNRLFNRFVQRIKEVSEGISPEAKCTKS